MNEDITPEELKKRLEQGEKLNLFDLREEWAYHNSNIGGNLLPLPTLPMNIDTLAALRSQEIIVHCQSGDLSLKAKKFLNSRGFKYVRSLLGGVDAYLQIK